MTAPSLTVKLDDGTGTFPFDITAKVMSLDGYEISRGREDWQGAVTAGELTLTLNNSDGRFTPGSTILGTPSPIVVDQRIQISESDPGFDMLGFGLGGFGGTNVRFTGYVKSWPVAWPAVVSAFATVSLTATDAQARAERRTLRSMLEEEILLRTPTAYYTLDEAEGSASAGDSSGDQSPALAVAGSGAAPVFGATTNLADGSTGVQFAGGQRLEIVRSGGAFLSGHQFSFVVFFTTTTPPSFQCSLLSLDSTDPSQSFATVDVGLEADGKPFVSSMNVGSTGPTSVTDGLPHCLGGTVVPGSGLDLMTAYADGADIGTTTTVPRDAIRLTVGDNSILPGDALRYTGIVAHLVLYDGISLSAADHLAIAQAGLEGFAGESGTARIARLASYAGVPIGILDDSLTNVPAQSTAGQSAQEAIQEVADAEMGLVFVDGSGSLTFYNRNRAAMKTAPDLVLDATYVTPDVQPVTDDQQIVNYFEATAAGTGASQVARDAISEDTHGRYPVSQDFLVQSDAEALDRANWIVSKQAEPTPRYGTLVINLYKMTDTLAATVRAALDLDCWLRVTSMGSQNPGGTVADVVIQGWRESASAESWTITCNVVSRSLYAAFILDSSLLDDPAAPLYV